MDGLSKSSTQVQHSSEENDAEQSRFQNITYTGSGWERKLFGPGGDKYSAGRVPAFQAGCRAFESRRPLQILELQMQVTKSFPTVLGEGFFVESKGRQGAGLQAA
jgi:hypothetical protein